MPRATAPVLLGFLLSVSVLAVVSQTGDSQGQAASQVAAADPVPVVLSSGRHDASPPLRSMPLLPPQPLMAEVRAPGPLPGRSEVGGAEPPARDPLLQQRAGAAAAPSPTLNFEGLGNVDFVLPPDSNGDIGFDPATGAKYYVQMLNLSFAIWNVSGTPALIYGPAQNRTLWQGLGGPCSTTNNGDPVVLFDSLAHRWLMSQFSVPNDPAGPYYQCIAVSQTADPTGGWYRYEFQISDTKLNDYAKFGVWPDAYYYSVNQFSGCPACAWAGAGVVAFERQQMLVGQTARMVYFDLYSLDPHLGGLLPSDLDGPVPPSGAPNYYVTMDDNAWGYSPDQVQVWQFHVDWVNPTSSTFTRSAVLPIAPVDLTMCGGARSCIPQPGTATGLDALAGQMMHRLQYRNFNTYQTLVGNITADVDGADHAGVRWFELRNATGAWSLYQEGTYAPDANHRWMGSIAMNGVGDMALGYSVSSKSVYPSIRFAGRLAADPAGQMTQGEGSLVAGGGSQTHSASRWGDYSMMAVDPSDDCTFWYTQEYYAVTGNANWRTRIGAFRLSDCGLPTPTPTVTSSPTPTATPTASSTPSPTPTATATPVFRSWSYLPLVLRDAGTPAAR
jgi:hypothetical protein